MMRMVAFILLLLYCLTSGQASATQILTLDDCIELALKNRASIIAARGAEALAKANQRTALGAFLPRVDASYRYSETKSREIKSDEFVCDSVEFYVDTIFVNGSQFEVLGAECADSHIEERDQDDQDRTSKYLSLTASMSVLDLTNVFDYASARADRAQARLDVIGSEQNLILAVKIAYYGYLAAVENVAVQDQAVERSGEQFKLINSKFELGSASLSDVLKQKVQVGNDRLAQLTAQNLVTTKRAQLAYTIGVDPNSDVDFSTDYAVVREFEGTLGEALSYGLSHKPSLLSAEKAIDAARHWVRGRKARYLPTLSAYASLGYSDGTRGDTVTFNFSDRSTTIGFQIDWTIFDGFNRERNLTAAKVNFNNAMAEMADERNLASANIRLAYLDIERQKETQVVAKENVDAAEEDLKITQEKYNLGAATILDLLDAQVSLKEAQVALIQADFDLNLAIAQLENAMGKM